MQGMPCRLSDSACIAEVPAMVELTAYCKSLLSHLSCGQPCSRAAATAVLKQAHLSALLMLLKDAGSTDNVLWALDQLSERFVTPDQVSDFLESHGGAIAACKAVDDARVQGTAERLLCQRAPGCGKAKPSQRSALRRVPAARLNGVDAEPVGGKDKPEQGGEAAEMAAEIC